MILRGERMRKILCIVLFIGVLAGDGAVSAQTSGLGDAIETTSSGKINWTVGEVYATGIGAPPASAVNAGQARAMTERAAVVVAYRNLLEVVKGVRVDSETVVENFITKSDVVRTRVEGIVKGARIVKKQYLSDGSVEVLIAMPLKGALMDAIVPETFGRPAGQQPLKPIPLPLKPSDIKQPSKPLSRLHPLFLRPLFLKRNQSRKNLCSRRRSSHLKRSRSPRCRQHRRRRGLRPSLKAVWLPVW